MANLHESYAPEINIVGAAHGGSVIDLTATVKTLDQKDNLFSGFVVGAIAGFLSAYPEHNATIWPHFSQAFQNKMNYLRSPRPCIIGEVLLYHNQENHNQMDVDFFTFPPMAELLARESLLKNVSNGVWSSPKFPRYMWHGEQDEVLPIAPVRQFIEEQCAVGADIQFVPWQGEHVSVEFLGIPNALQFVVQAFEGTTPKVQCGASSNDILTLTSTAVGGVIGDVVVDLLKAINVIATPLGQITFNWQQGASE